MPEAGQRSAYVAQGVLKGADILTQRGRASSAVVCNSDTGVGDEAGVFGGDERKCVTERIGGRVASYARLCASKLAFNA